MRPSTPRRHLFGAIGLMTAWLLFATGELLYGELDAMTEPAAIAAASGRFGAGALLQLAAAVMLAIAVVTLIGLTRDRTPRLSHAGGFLALLGVVGVGAWAQFHLVVLELSTAGLDTAVVSEFLNGSLQDFGLWGIPIMFVLLPLPIGLILLTIATSRTGISSRWVPYAIGFYLLFHLALPGGGEWSQVASHYLLAATLAWVGVDVLRYADDRPGRGAAPTPATSAPDLAEAAR
jgi:hypothetical protein